MSATATTSVENVFVLSTGHLKRLTSTLFDQISHVAGDLPEDGDGFPFRISSHTYGWILFILREPNEDEDQQLEDLKLHELKKIFKLARKNNCQMILFDRDGEFEAELPRYEW